LGGAYAPSKNDNTAVVKRLPRISIFQSKKERRVYYSTIAKKTFRAGGDLVHGAKPQTWSAGVKQLMAGIAGRKAVVSARHDLAKANGAQAELLTKKVAALTELEILRLRIAAVKSTDAIEKKASLYAELERLRSY